MKKFFIGFKTFYILVFFLCSLLISSCNIIYEDSPQDYFNNPQVVDLLDALENGDNRKIEKLVSFGVDVNFLGRDNITPLYWFISKIKDENPFKKNGFRKLLELGADPLLVYEESGWTAFLLAARHFDSDYLKMILETQSEIDIDFVHREELSAPTVLFHAFFVSQYENAKILIDHGADIDFEDSVGRKILWHESFSTSWKGVYILLKNGADYLAGKGVVTQGNQEGKTDIVWSLENSRYWPSVAIGYSIIDYRQKVVEFLREKGVEVNPWMPEDEKYELENGKSVLYIREESGEWVKFEDSSRYED